jgi:uroporphyrinogen decarboxylase
MGRCVVIKTLDDWRAERHRMAFNPSRIPDSVIESYAKSRESGRFICYSAHACFHPTWMRIGMEQMLMAMLDDPAFIDAIYTDHVQLVIDIYEGMLARGMVFDGAFLSDDLGYQVAPLISPTLYRSLVMPHHKRLCDRFAADGLKTLLHSDGNLVPLIPHFIEAGFAGLHPLEAKAGMDIRDIRDRFGDALVLIGNIDVRKLAGSHEEIEAEVRGKVTEGKAGRGYIYHSDHSVPSDVSFEAYAYAIEMVRKYGAYG